MEMLERHFGRFGNRLFQLAYVMSQARKGEIPDIYVQGEEYFEEAKGPMRELFAAQVQRSNFVGIHVRRGDYVGNPFYVDLFADGYYERAMAEFPNREFRVFSDDPEWCKGQEIFRDCVIVPGSEQEDFLQLAGCDGVIMANSSFSWWAAWLSRGKVVAPAKWYGDGVERTKLLVTWQRA